MNEVRVNLLSIDEVKSFVQLVNEYPYEVDLVSGRYVVDAKSIMGIFSLDLTEPLNVQIHADDPSDLPDRLKAMFG